MTCNEVHRVRARMLALELTPDEERAVRAHAAGCRECRELLIGDEPGLALAWRMAELPLATDEGFTADVMAGIRQRSVDRRASSGRRRWLAAAAVIVAAIGGTLVMRHSGVPATGVALHAAAPVAAEVPFLEVEGRDVRVYQFATAADSDIRAAFVVNPHMEL